MVDRGTRGPKPNGVMSIFFDRMLDGSWTASTETADGKIAGTGKTVIEARRALDALQKLLVSKPST
jgi:hypothetical protein